jgi:hypothetical protein
MFWPPQKPDFGLFVVFKPFRVPVLLNHQRKRLLITNLTSTTVQLHHKIFSQTHYSYPRTKHPRPSPDDKGLGNETSIL